MRVEHSGGTSLPFSVQKSKRMLDSPPISISPASEGSNSHYILANPSRITGNANANVNLHGNGILHSYRHGLEIGAENRTRRKWPQSDEPVATRISNTSTFHVARTDFGFAAVTVAAAAVAPIRKVQNNGAALNGTETDSDSGSDVSYSGSDSPSSSFSSSDDCNDDNNRDDTLDYDDYGSDDGNGDNIEANITSNIRNINNSSGSSSSSSSKTITEIFNNNNDNDDGDEENEENENVYAVSTFVATVAGQATVLAGDVLQLLDDSNAYWWLVRCVQRNEWGYIPAINVETPNERLARVNVKRNVIIGQATPEEVLGESRSIFSLKRRKSQRKPSTNNSALSVYSQTSNGSSFLQIGPVNGNFASPITSPRRRITFALVPIVFTHEIDDDYEDYVDDDFSDRSSANPVNGNIIVPTNIDCSLSPPTLIEISDSNSTNNTGDQNGRSSPTTSEDSYPHEYSQIAGSNQLAFGQSNLPNLPSQSRLKGKSSLSKMMDRVFAKKGKEEPVERGFSPKSLNASPLANAPVVKVPPTFPVIVQTQLPQLPTPRSSPPIIRIYPGNIDTLTTYKTIPFTPTCTAAKLLSIALARFKRDNPNIFDQMSPNSPRFAGDGRSGSDNSNSSSVNSNDPNPGDFYLSVLHMDSCQRVLENDVVVWEFLEALRKKDTLPGLSKGVGSIGRGSDGQALMDRKTNGGGESGGAALLGNSVFDDDKIIRVILNYRTPKLMLVGGLEEGRSEVGRLVLSNGRVSGGGSGSSERETVDGRRFRNSNVSNSNVSSNSSSASNDYVKNEFAGSAMVRSTSSSVSRRRNLGGVSSQNGYQKPQQLQQQQQQQQQQQFALPPRPPKSSSSKEMLARVYMDVLVVGVEKSRHDNYNSHRIYKTIKIFPQTTALE
ncbi:hypothetical protein HK100_008154, partial [Physocladia obscura]